MFFINAFIGVTLLNKVIYVLSVWFYDTWSLYCIVCPPSKVKLSSVTISLVPFTLTSPSTPLPSGNHRTVCAHEGCLFCFVSFSLLVQLLLSVLYPIYEWKSRILNFFWLMFHVPWYSQGPSMLSQMAGLPSFLWLSSIPLQKCATPSLRSHLSKDTSVVPMSQLPWVMLQHRGVHIFTNKYSLHF